MCCDCRSTVHERWAVVLVRSQTSISSLTWPIPGISEADSKITANLSQSTRLPTSRYRFVGNCTALWTCNTL
jgi:hypothetical protein